MDELPEDEKTVRDYLLGRVSDETRLEGIEELLFTDEEFCSRVALVEDDIINDYVLGHLDEADARSFRATLAGNPERLIKLEITEALRKKALAANAKAAQKAPSFLASLGAFFSRPKFAVAFAALLIAVLASTVYFVAGGRPDELAELREVYRQERPTETRISDFDYAPLTQLRGAPQEREGRRLRRIENDLIERTEKSPNEETHHALGVFYLTQQKYGDAIREFESALKFSGTSARTHNDLGAAHFELAKSSAPEKKLEHLSRALEEFTAATELDGDSPEALFNKSLALQELRLPREARESWTLYLQKDASSPWAEEARRNLARVEDARTQLRTDEQVLRDFLAAFREHDDARALKIHNETKGLLKGPAVALQLSRLYLTAKRRGDEAGAKESLDAMAFVGDFEKAQHSEFFFLSWQASTPASGRTRPTACCAPRSCSTAGFASCSTVAGNASRAIT
jgi:tetratricopeptide (TPR) repeat protein